MNTRFVGPEFFTNYCKFFSIQLSSMIGRRDAHFKYLESVFAIHWPLFRKHNVPQENPKAILLLKFYVTGVLAPTILKNRLLAPVIFGHFSTVGKNFGC